MKNRSFKEWLKKPHGITLVLVYIFTVIFIGLSILSMLYKGDSIVVKILSYVVYALSAVGLGYSIYTIVIYAPRIKNGVEESLKKNAILSNLMEDYTYKTAIFSIISVIITIAFASTNLVGAIRYKRIWYGAIAIYYFLLLLFRGGILLANRLCYKRQSGLDYERSKLKIYMSGGILLLIIEFAMASLITNLMLSENPSQKGEIMTIATAAYTFYKMTMAIINLVKARKTNNPITQALRNINLADACMSLVSLTVLMLSTFGGGSELIYIKAGVGFAVCALIIVLSVIMISRAVKGLKELKGAEENEGR